MLVQTVLSIPEIPPEENPMGIGRAPDGLLDSKLPIPERPEGRCPHYKPFTGDVLISLFIESLSEKAKSTLTFSPDSFFFLEQPSFSFRCVPS
jgi:hypothetical protein